jgi:anti-anti-sigma factor
METEKFRNPEQPAIQVPFRLEGEMARRQICLCVEGTVNIDCRSIKWESAVTPNGKQAETEGIPMELELSHENGYVLVSTRGRIDDAIESILKEQLHPLVGQRGTRIVLDLSQSNYITSRGIGSLVSLVVHANASGSRVIIAACSPFITKVLETAKLNKFFEMTPTVSEAISLLMIPM